MQGAGYQGGGAGGRWEGQVCDSGRGPLGLGLHPRPRPLPEPALGGPRGGAAAGEGG